MWAAEGRPGSGHSRGVLQEGMLPSGAAGGDAAMGCCRRGIHGVRVQPLPAPEAAPGTPQMETGAALAPQGWQRGQDSALCNKAGSSEGTGVWQGQGVSPEQGLS